MGGCAVALLAPAGRTAEVPAVRAACRPCSSAVRNILLPKRLWVVSDCATRQQRCAAQMDARLRTRGQSDFRLKRSTHTRREYTTRVIREVRSRSAAQVGETRPATNRRHVSGSPVDMSASRMSRSTWSHCLPCGPPTLAPLRAGPKARSDAWARVCKPGRAPDIHSYYARSVSRVCLQRRLPAASSSPVPNQSPLAVQCVSPHMHASRFARAARILAAPQHTDSGLKIGALEHRRHSALPMAPARCCRSSIITP